MKRHISFAILFLLVHLTGFGQGRHAKLLQVASHGKYQLGWYTLQDGTRHAAKLRIWQTLTSNLVQVDQGKADPINLSPTELRCFTMGSDSFIVAQHVAVAGMPTTQPFGETDIYRMVLAGKLQILEHDQLVAARGPYGPSQSHEGAWVLRPSDSADLVIVPADDKAFAQHVAPFFAENPALAQRIRAGLLGIDDFERIVYAYVFKKEIEQVSYEEAGTLFH